MPTVMVIGPYRFHFYSRENAEPPHIHVLRDNQEAKFWLRPVSIAVSRGFHPAELRDVERLVEQHCEKLLEAFYEFHGGC